MLLVGEQRGWAFERAVEEIGEQPRFRDFNLRGFIASDNGVDYGIVKLEPSN